MSDTVLHYIGGQKTAGASTRTQDIFNSASRWQDTRGCKRVQVLMWTRQLPQLKLLFRVGQIPRLFAARA